MPPPDRLTVATFNTHWGQRPGSHQPFDVVAVCRRLDADVLALQEVWRPDGETSAAECAADALGYQLHQLWTARAVVEPKHKAVGPPGAPIGTGDWGQALLTRVPRGPVTEHHLDGFLFDPISRAVMTTPVELAGGTLTVCASHFPHLEHFSPLLRWRLRGVLPEPHDPAVLMGDLNMWRWVTRFVVPGWRDTARGPTWPSPRPVFQIDHILVTSPVVATGAEVVRAGHSDHLPIRATVGLTRVNTATAP
jgi:endonuclease/exonuclease/phosphatase family metal-dependent hydrolase